MSKRFQKNFLSDRNGCRVIKASSEREGAQAHNVILDSGQIWYIEDALPQYCIIDTSNLSTYPKVFNRICFYCWHQYETNPQLIEVSYSRNEDEDGEWTVAGELKLSQVNGKQYFKIQDIPVTQMKLLRITILKNFGDKHTYLNQVELGFVKEGNSDESRQKTFSSYVKLTSTERQLKRTLDQMKSLTHQHEDLKATVKKQNQLIFKMQESMKQMTKHIQKMHEVQEFQAAKIKMLEQSSRRSPRVKSRQKSEDRIRFNSKDVSSGSEAEENKFYIQDDFIHKKTMLVPNKSSSFHKSSKRDTFNYIDSKKTSKMQSILKSRELESDPNFSQYDSDEDERSKHSEKCTQLVHKLQKLLIEKEKRQKQLSKKGVKE